MRRILFSVFSTLITAAYLLPCVEIPAQDSPPPSTKYTMPINPPAWARNDEGFSVVTAPNDELNGAPATHVVHKTPTDWAIRIPQSLDVQPGQIYTLKCKAKNLGSSACRTGVILYDANNVALNWAFGGTEIYAAEEWQTVESKFIVPESVARVEARIIGNGQTDAYIASYEIESAGKVEVSSLQGTLPAENRYLRLVFNLKDASFSIRDVRTGRVWSQTSAGRSQFVLGAEPVERGIKFRLLDASTFCEYDATIQLEKDAPEIVVKLSADSELPFEGEIAYPYPFQSRSTDRIILPVNEGISFPSTEQAYGAERLHTYGGHGLCMAFWAIVDDKLNASESSGLMGILETPDDSIVETKPREPDPSDANAVKDSVQTLAIGMAWQSSMRKFSYERVARLIVFDQGGYVAACKRYRQYAKEIGLHVTFDQKIERNPKLAQGIDRLIGAANIWCWNGRSTEMVPKLQEAGFDHILWSGGGSGEDIAKLNALEGVLTSRYDIYQDIMDPSRYDELESVHGDWIPEAWPQDLSWDSPDGKWTRGWEVDAKDRTKPRIPCGVLCDLKAVNYARQRIGKELETIPYRGRFLDTTVASPWRECWNPDHPASRTECKHARMDLLGLLGREFNLVCGSETGIDASVPYCDFYEGMTSLGPYRCPESGRYLTKLWEEVPEVVEKYQFGEQYRLPLFELVYHGCVVSYWYWGDHNNKFPSLWRKRDLFNALYGTPPMYGFLRDYFDENRDRFIESYRIAEPVSRMTGRSAMEDHQILTEDRTVQKTVYANGVEVIVNFGSKEYQTASGEIVPAESSKIISYAKQNDRRNQRN